MAAVTVQACQSLDAPGGPAGVFQDSAGIVIVTNTARSVADAQEWRVAAAPLVRIGASGGPEDALAYVTSVVRLRDGRIIVANGISNEVRFYSDSGTLLMSVGREGEGPGEYRALWRLCPIEDDSIAVWDVQLRRLTILSPHGQYIRSHRLAGVGGEAPAVRACTGTSRVLIGPEDRYKFRDLNQVRRDTLPLVAFDVRSGEIDTIGRFAGEEQYELEVPPMWLVEQAPFGASTSFAASPTSLVVADNSRDEIRLLGLTGKLKRIVRTGSPAAEVTAEDRAQFRDANIDESWRPSYLAAKRAFIDEAPFPDRMPYFGAVLIDELHRIWISQYLPSHVDGMPSTQWTILGVDGDAVATVETPARFSVMQAGDGWLLGVAHDEDDVEEVRLLRFDAAK